MNNASHLYPNEEVRNFNKFPSLLYYKEANPEKDLIVFIAPSVLARAAYGTPDTQPEDFLAYHFHKQEHPFLAINAPVQHPIFNEVFPGLSITDWGNLSVEVVETIVKEKNLSGNIVCVTWGISSRLINVFNNAIRALPHINLRYFSCISAAPPLPLINNQYRECLKPNKLGMADVIGELSPYFKDCLKEQNELNAREIINYDHFLETMGVNVPVAIFGTELQFLDGKFIADIPRLIRDIQMEKFTHHPFFQFFRPTSMMHIEGFMNHAILDSGAWRLVMTNHLVDSKIIPAKEQIANLPDDTWHEIIDYAQNIYKEMIEDVSGNLMCIFGELGASTIANKILAYQNKIDLINQFFKTRI